MIRCSIRTTVRYTPTRMAKIRTTTIIVKFKNLVISCVDQDVEQLEPSYATDESIN